MLIDTEGCVRSNKESVMRDELLELRAEWRRLANRQEEIEKRAAELVEREVDDFNVLDFVAGHISLDEFIDGPKDDPSEAIRRA
jgi:hypothetical protein